MATPQSLEILKDHRAALLLVAAGALLHNLGKITHQFLKWQIKETQLEEGDAKSVTDKSKYLYQHILHLIDNDRKSLAQISAIWPDYDNLATPENDVLSPETIAALTNRSIQLPQPLNDRDYSPGDLMEYLGQGDNDDWYKAQQNDKTQQKDKFKIEELFADGSRLTHLMNRSHRGASGGEKQSIDVKGQTEAADLYLATPFGWETKAPNVDDIDNLKNKIEACINKYFPILTNIVDYIGFRDELIPLLRQATADTRRPVNDVTVADIGLTGTAFLLSQAGNQILSGKTKSQVGHAEFAKEGKDNTLFWKVLSLRTDGLAYLNSAPTLADVRVRRKRFDNTLTKLNGFIRNFVVIQEIYRDENGVFYLTPDFDENGEIFRSLLAILKPTIEIDGLILTHKLSPQLVSHPNDIKDGVQYVGDYILEELRQVSIPTTYNVETFIKSWNNEGRVCSACGIRPQRKLSDKETAEGRAALCNSCTSDRNGVASDWLQNELTTTIWLDEVADINGRFALIVGQWKLEDFLSRMFYPKKEEDPKAPKDFLLTVDFIDDKRPQAGAVFTVKQRGFNWLGKNQFKGNVSFQKALREEAKGFKTSTIPGLSGQVIKNIEKVETNLILTLSDNIIDTEVIAWGQKFEVCGTDKIKTPTETASDIVKDAAFYKVKDSFFKIKHIVPAIPGELVQNYSFARIRRSWETTRQFWKEIVDDNALPAGGQSVIAEKVKEVQLRLQIKPGNVNGILLESNNAYELVFPNSDYSVSALWDGACERFVLIDNLEYLAKLLDKDVSQALIGNVKITRPTGYGIKSQSLGAIEVKQEHVTEIPNSEYTPLIKILAEPRTFMALVPADKAMEIAKAIEKKYAREMGKVRNRLPLTLGVVFAQRRTPLSTVLDAGRRMLKQPNQAEQWTVESVTPVSPDPKDNWPKEIELTLEKAGQKLTLCVPTVMGDKATPDVWYPYWEVVSDANGTIPMGRERQFEGPDKDIWVHVCDLKEGDKVCWTPSHFDFEYLDTGARRFEISYENGKRRVLQNAPTKTRPYYLEELEDFETLWGILEQSLHKTQIKDLDAIIERKRLEWGEGEVFQQFVADAVCNASWIEGKKPKDEEIKQLIVAARSGQLSDVIELYTEILKKKPKSDEVSSNKQQEAAK